MAIRGEGICAWGAAALSTLDPILFPGKLFPVSALLFPRRSDHREGKRGCEGGSMKVTPLQVSLWSILKKKSFFDNKIAVPLRCAVCAHAVCVSALASIDLHPNLSPWQSPVAGRKEKVPPEEYFSCPRTDVEDRSQESHSLKVKPEELHSLFLSDRKPGKFYSSPLQRCDQRAGDIPQQIPWIFGTCLWVQSMDIILRLSFRFPGHVSLVRLERQRVPGMQLILVGLASFSGEVLELPRLRPWALQLLQQL